MTALLNFYWQLTRTDGGQIDPYGNLDTPVNGGTTVSGGPMRVQRYQIVAGDTKVLWDFDQFTYDFEMIALQIIGDGYLNLAVRHDSTSSGSPTGNAQCWQHHDLSNITPFIINSRVAYAHADPATSAGDTADEPSLWAASDKIVGIVDRIMVWNQQTADPVTLDMLIIQ